MIHDELVLILDFGSQYTQLIARRIRESGVYSEIHPFSISLEKIKSLKPRGIILSGGPQSVYDNHAPELNTEIFSFGVPILGICYGLQLICKALGGKVEPAHSREYGKARLNIVNDSELLLNVRGNSVVWMSHGDYVTDIPKGYEISGVSENSPFCVISDTVNRIYGLQFHPEVAHTEEGKKIIDNFLFTICKFKGEWTSKHFIETSINEIKTKVGEGKALCALSGGVDSSVAAILVHQAIGDKLICAHVDTGLMRKDESRLIAEMFEKNYNLHIIHIDASEIFLSRLAGVTNPEMKRKIIGNTFIEVFEEHAKQFDNISYLIQGTLYPDVIESVAVTGASVTIKTHHNVGGLPEKMNLKLIEPFRELFKDEVRKIGRELGLPEEFIARHPFPGPGLAVRVLGNITEEKLKILRESDDIFINEIKRAGLYDKIWQAFAVLLPVQTVGVMGDARTYENVIALRAVTSTDGMTADWYPFEHEFLAEVSDKIIRNIRGVNRVVYDISTKPPSTIEWE
ncbi:MAG: glutamine-hydrolyzing GMP synthase [Ignavibacteria bacterium]